MYHNVLLFESDCVYMKGYEGDFSFRRLSVSDEVTFINMISVSHLEIKRFICEYQWIGIEFVFALLSIKGYVCWLPATDYMTSYMTDFWVFLIDMSSKSDRGLGASLYSRQETKSSSDLITQTILLNSCMVFTGMSSSCTFTEFVTLDSERTLSFRCSWMSPNVLHNIFCITIVPTSTAESQFIVLHPQHQLLMSLNLP